MTPSTPKPVGGSRTDAPPRAATDPVPVLEITGLKTRFRTRDGAVAAVDGLSLAVAPHEILGLVGESGCGKSTAALSIMRLLPPYAEIAAGRILLDGRDLVLLRDGEMRALRGAKVSMIFQDALTALDPTMTIGRQIMEPLRLHLRLSARDAARRARELLETVGISAPARRLGQYPHEFSGGMRQRVMIAVALACSPRLLLADEPTTALDVTVQQQILGLLLRLRDQVDAGIILITHDVGVVSEVCDAVVVMYAGRKVEGGPTERVFTRPFHPYTRGLLGSTLGEEWDRDKPLPAIQGLPPDPTNLPCGCVFAPRCPRATDICHAQAPLFEDHEPGHGSACWHWEEA